MKLHPQATVVMIPFTARVDNYKVKARRPVNPLADAICAIPKSYAVIDAIIGPSVLDYATGDTMTRGKIVCWRWFKAANPAHTGKYESTYERVE